MTRRKLRETMLHSFVGGIFTGLGITVGIAILAYILSLIVNLVGGLPLVGNYLANIIEATIYALNNRGIN